MTIASPTVKEVNECLDKIGFSTGHYQLVIALPNGNADEELPWRWNWLAHHHQVETSVDNGDGEVSQTGVR